MRRAAATLGTGLLVLSLTVAACCPVTAPPKTAFVAELRPLGHGTARALLADGRELLVTGLASVPTGTVYVTGTLLADGSVAAIEVQPFVAPQQPAGAP